MTTRPVNTNGWTIEGHAIDGSVEDQNGTECVALWVRDYPGCRAEAGTLEEATSRLMEILPAYFKAANPPKKLTREEAAQILLAAIEGQDCGADYTAAMRMGAAALRYEPTRHVAMLDEEE